MPGQLDQDAAISLPGSLFNDSRDTVGLFFVLYDRPRLFPIDKGSAEVGSRVLAATVGNPDFLVQDLIENVTIVFRLVTNKVRLGRTLHALTRINWMCLVWYTVCCAWFRDVCFLEFCPSRMDPRRLYH